MSNTTTKDLQIGLCEFRLDHTLIGTVIGSIVVVTITATKERTDDNDLIIYRLPVYLLR